MKLLIRRIILSILFATIITAICVSGILFDFANLVNDAIYQRPQAPDERIVIIGIDDRSIAEFGSWPWDREIMAQAISYLNSDPETMPAIIGVDAVFDSPGDPEDDSYFAEVVGQYSNIVMGTFAVFGSELVTNEDGSFYIDDYAVLDFKESYDELRENVMQGHVNAMLDDDGILRHAIWEIDLPDGRTMPAFYRVVAEEYAKITGLEPITAPPTDARGRWYVVQQSLPHSYSDMVSVVDLVNGDLPSHFFDDKIVLIGPYATGLQDEYKTPISSAENMYGVEYQANAIGALLLGNTKYEPVIIRYAIVFLISFISLFLMYKKRLAFCTILWFISCMAVFIVCIIAFELGVVLYILYGLVAVTAVFITSIIRNYLRQTRERRVISDTFNRYVAPEIVSELLKNDAKDLSLGGKVVDIAVLFADVRGFTTLSSKLPAKDVVEIINKILSMSSEQILNNRGTLDKYIGDCTMAFWGAPLPQENYIFNAVKAALDISDKLNELIQEIENEYGYTLGCGIGVSCGPAIVGNIGSQSRMDYTVIGETVNIASRLEGIAGGSDVFVSRDVVLALKGKVEFKYLGNDYYMKGIEDNFEVYKAIRVL